MQYRLGTYNDLDDICSLIKQAIAEMESHGIYQWDELYPMRDDFTEDIEKNTLYLAIDDDDLVAMYVISVECDEQYENAKWKYDGNSAYILHRFCVSPNYQNKGMGKTVLNHIEEQI